MAGLLDLLSQTWPARLGRSAGDAAKLPGDVYAGRVTPNDPEYYDRATDLAGLLGLVSVRGLTAPAAESLASRSPRMYNPAAKPLRPFEADYPAGAQADAAGRLATDIEGRPLAADTVVGRSALGGRDQALAPAEIDALGKALTGNNPVGVAAREIQKNAGLFRIQYGTDGRPVYRILVDQAQPPLAREKIAAHETSHAIDY